MDWEKWASNFEKVQGPDQFAALFAEGGVFCDPVTPWTEDVRSVAEGTDQIFPDWHSRVDRIRGGEDWAVFEWTGTGTFGTGEPSSPKVAIVMEGATIVEVDGHGKVTRWRDYLDTNEPMQQIQAGQASA